MPREGNNEARKYRMSEQKQMRERPVKTVVKGEFTVKLAPVAESRRHRSVRRYERAGSSRQLLLSAKRTLDLDAHGRACSDLADRHEGRGSPGSRTRQRMPIGAEVDRCSSLEKAILTRLSELR